MNINQIPINIKKDEKPIYNHQIPPHIGIGSEEDSLQSVFHLKPKPHKVSNLVELAKINNKKMIFKARLITSIEIERERQFILTFNIADKTIEVYESSAKNSGRLKGKFFERAKVKNKLTNEYYTERDIVVGANIYLNNYIFKLLECDKKTFKYMQDNSDVFIDSDIDRIIRRIKLESSKYSSLEDFLIALLMKVDPCNKGHVSKSEIIDGFKQFDLYLSPHEELFFFDLLENIRNKEGFNMEDLFDLIKLW